MHILTTADDRDFCVIPLSSDCNFNPFRVEMSHIRDTPFLLHAVLALASQHLAKLNSSIVMSNEMNTHWSTAMQLFSSALGNPKYRPILDTLLILVHFEVSSARFLSNLVRSLLVHKPLS
jgi:hypothetical protein